jgi:predicted HTH transcriptional regulator
VTFIKIRSHRRKFSNSDSVEQKTILRVLTRAQETGKVLPNRNEIGGGARTARTLANEQTILNIVEEDETRSIKEIAQELDISSRSVVHRVLKQNRILKKGYIQSRDSEGTLSHWSWSIELVIMPLIDL